MSKGLKYVIPNYISNARREDMLVALKEFIAHAEGRAPESTDTLQ